MCLFNNDFFKEIFVLTLYSSNKGHKCYCLLKKLNIRGDCDVYCLVIVQLLVSGGVDSTVCAALLHKALCEDQVIAVHIDNGFMRKNESQRVEQSLEKLGLRVKGSVRVNVNERVLSSLLELSYTH